MDEQMTINMVEFLIILVSQQETRRFVKYLIKDVMFINRVRRTSIYESSIIVQRLIESLESYLFENEEAAYTRLTLLKKLAFKYFPDELSKSSTNQQNEAGSLVGKTYIQKAMEEVDYKIILLIAKNMRINTSLVEKLYSDESERKKLLIELIGDKILVKNDILSGQSVESTASLINEKEYTDAENAMIPIILDYNSLDVMDYMYRLFHASRKDLVKNVRKQIDYLTQNIGPQFDLNNQFEGFQSWNKDAVVVNYCRILNIKAARLGTEYPDQVLAEAEFDLSAFSSAVQEMWVGLRSGEILVFATYVNTKQGPVISRLRS